MAALNRLRETTAYSTIRFDLGRVDTYHTRPMSEAWSQLRDIDRLVRRPGRCRFRDPAERVSATARAARQRSRRTVQRAWRSSAAKPGSRWRSSRCRAACSSSASAAWRRCASRWMAARRSRWSPRKPRRIACRRNSSRCAPRKVASGCATWSRKKCCWRCRSCRCMRIRPNARRQRRWQRRRRSRPRPRRVCRDRLNGWASC